MDNRVLLSTALDEVKIWEQLESGSSSLALLYSKFSKYIWKTQSDDYVTIWTVVPLIQILEISVQSRTKFSKFDWILFSDLKSYDYRVTR